MIGRVLIVDDDEAIRDALRLVLEEEGYEVLEAKDGAAALKLLRATPDRMVVLLDQLMPQVSGTEVLRAVRDDPHLTSYHAYILLSARSRISPLLLECLVESLAVPVVRKPFELDALLEVITRAAQRLSAAPRA